MADENTAPETETEASAPAAAIPDATGDAGQQSLDLPVEGDAAPKPEDAAGETSPAGNPASAATDAAAPAPADEAAPTTTDPVAPEAPGTSESPTPVAEDSVDADVAASVPAGADEAAPAMSSTPDAEAPAAEEAAPAADPTASSADAPAEAAPALDQDTSTSTGIGGDKAADVEPAEEPKLDPAPAPSPAPSSPGLFDHGAPLNLPDMSVPSDAGYPIAQPDATPVHPQTLQPLVNDGVLDDAGKVADDATGSISSSDKSAPETEGSSDSEDSEPVISDVEGYQPEADEEQGEPSAAPSPHVEGKLKKLLHRLENIEHRIEKVLKHLLEG